MLEPKHATEAPRAAVSCISSGVRRTGCGGLRAACQQQQAQLMARDALATQVLVTGNAEAVDTAAFYGETFLRGRILFFPQIDGC